MAVAAVVHVAVAAVTQSVGKLRKDSFMQSVQVSVCIRCGKERVFQKTWKVKTENSVLTYTRSICSDAACQKIVDKELTALKEKRAFHAQKRLHSKNRKAFA